MPLWNSVLKGSPSRVCARDFLSLFEYAGFVWSWTKSFCIFFLLVVLILVAPPPSSSSYLNNEFVIRKMGDNNVHTLSMKSL